MRDQPGAFWRVFLQRALMGLALGGTVLTAAPSGAAQPVISAPEPTLLAQRPRRPWRPKWWPAWLPAGTGEATILIRVRRQRLYVHDGHRGWTHFPISTGAHGATPRGRFRVVSKVRRPAWSYRGQYVPGGIPANPLGACWLGLSAPSWWRGAPIGIHGTNAPWLIGQPVSRGCIRMYNRDALRLYRMVPRGSRVFIVSARPAGAA